MGTELEIVHLIHKTFFPPFATNYTWDNHKQDCH